MSLTSEQRTSFDAMVSLWSTEDPSGNFSAITAFPPSVWEAALLDKLADEANAAPDDSLVLSLIREIESKVAITKTCPEADLVAVAEAQSGWNNKFKPRVLVFARALGWTGPTGGNPPSDPIITSVTPNTGDVAGGIVVTIVGENFVDGAKVTFGGVDGADIVFVSATKLTTKVPAHVKGVVDIVVTNPDPDGQPATKTDGFTYTKAPDRSGDGGGGGSGDGGGGSVDDQDDEGNDEPGGLPIAGVSLADVSELVRTVSYGNIESFKVGANAVTGAINALSPHMAKPPAPSAATGAAREAPRPKRTWVLPVILGLGFAGLIGAVLLAGLLLFGGGLWTANVVEGPAPPDPTVGTPAAPVDLGDDIHYEDEVKLVLRRRPPTPTP